MAPAWCKGEDSGGGEVAVGLTEDEDEVVEEAEEEGRGAA